MRSLLVPYAGIVVVTAAFMTGCSEDQIDLVHLSFDSPILLPTYSVPSDSLQRPRISLTFSRPSVRVREGFLSVTQPNVDWPFDSISGPSGSGFVPLRRKGANLAATRWELPEWQGGLSFEFHLVDRTILGLGAHGSTGPSGTRWYAEGRMAIDATTKAPLRFSLGGFYGRHDVRAAYLRRVDGGSPLLSWTAGHQVMVGLFADLSFVLSAQDRRVVPLLGLTLVHHRIFRHRIPSPDPEHHPVDVMEWMSLWGFSFGVRGHLSSSTDLIVGARLVLDASIENTATSAFVMPMAQIQVYL